MGTKLDSVVDTLRDLEYDTKIINTLIIDYFSDQNSNEFETDDKIFVVLSYREIQDEKYDLAEEIFDDKVYDLERLVANTRNFVLNKIIECIDRDSVIDSIISNLDYELEKDYTLLSEKDYFVYFKN